MKDRKSRSGQSLVEYIIAFAALLAVCAAAAGLLSAAKRDSVRTSAITASEYP